MTKEERLHPKVGAVMKEGPYCTFWSKFVSDECYHDCWGHCRFREVMIDIKTESGKTILILDILQN